jgi:PAS domain S-box-containing protein
MDKMETGKELKKYAEELEKEILEHKKSEDSLRKSQLQFQTLAMVSPVGIFRSDQNGNTTYVNQKWCELTGLSSEEAIGTGWIKAIHPEDRGRLSEKWKNDLKSARESTAEYRFLKPDGNIVWVIGNAVPEIIGDELTGYIGTVTDITERKLSEERLKSSEESLKILFDYAPDAYYLSDLKGNFIDGNIACEILMGYDKIELIGKNFLKLNLLSLKQLPKAAKLLIKNSLGQPTGPDEFVLSRKNGSEAAVEIITHPVKIKGQTLVLGLARDITGRKLAVEALRASEKKYRGIFENVQDVYYETSIDGTILEISPSIDLMSNGQYHRKDLVGKSMNEFYSYPGERQLIIAALQEKGFITDFEVRLKNRDGSLIPCSISSRILFDTDGQPEKIIGSMRDISARKKAEEEMRTSETRYRSLFENAGEGILYISGKAELIRFNESFARMHGYTHDELQKLNLHDLDVEDLSQEFPERLNRIINGENMSFEVKHYHKDGHIIDLEVSAFGVILKGESNIVAFHRDITERKNSNEILKLAKDKAEESDRLKTAFLHNISHEIRTPMNAIVGFSALLSEPDIDEASKASFIETITQSSDHLLAIINDIIEVSNIEAGILKFNREEVKINKVIFGLFDQFSLKASEKNLEFFKDTPLPDSEATIVMDKTKFVEILSNLLTNAFKFTGKGKIKFGYIPADHSINFYVSDTGIGVAEDQLHRIFDRFYQVEHTLERHFEGTGLGLSISKAFVELMGGRIWVESEYGKGSTFWFSIPSDYQLKTSKPASETVAEAFFTKHATILIAEDDENNYNLIVNFLADPNLNLVRAKNGLEAVKYCEAGNNVDLVLMDLKMPEMDGYEATVRIKSLFPNLKVVAQTAYVADKEKALDSGCIDIITKPFKKKDLLDLVKNYLK